MHEVILTERAQQELDLAHKWWAENRSPKQADKWYPTAFPDVNGLQDDIVRITQQLFPGEVAIDVTDDPEFPQDAYTVVRAQASGEIKEIEDRRIEWHERISKLSENGRLLRLSLDYQS